MPLRTVMLLLLALVLAVFVAVNWTAFMTPTVLSLIVTSVQAPLGLVMLVITGLLAALFLGYALYLQGSVLLETRRMTRDLQSQRQLADQAEASRFTELRGTLETRLDQLATTLADDRTRHAAEMARFSDELKLALDHAANGLAAQVGELEDRMVRQGIASPGAPAR